MTDKLKIILILITIEEENMLKPQRGKSLPLRIGRTADGEELLK